MRQEELIKFVGVPVDAVIMNSRMVIRGVIDKVEDGYVRFSSIEDLFVLVHGRRLSIRLMLAGSFMELEELLQRVLIPCNLFESCRQRKLKA
ncbi:hypothetical protein HRbin37_00277 [bacterium HR37]|nr:hypothetical protein HRbin37_00277 [bacterium HR37]